MKVIIPMREGEVTVETSSGTWTEVYTRISYQPNEEAMGEVAGSLPSLKPGEIRDLIGVLEFVLERGDRA